MTQERKNEFIRAMIEVIEDLPVGIECLEGMITLEEGEDPWVVWHEFTEEYKK